MENLAFLAAGLAAGIFSGSLGVGGALLATPLIRFLGVSPYLAVGTTVPVLLPTTLTGAITYGRAGLLDRRAAGWIALGGAAGAVAGAFTTRQIPGHVLMLATAAVLVVLAARLLPGSSTEPTRVPRHAAAGLAALGLVTGFFSGLLGIGGGFLIVPALIRLFGFPTKTALGTSLAAITIIALPNVIAQQLVGNIDWRVALLLGIGVIPGARIGAQLSIRAPDRILRITIAIALIAVGVVYAVSELTALSSP